MGNLSKKNIEIFLEDFEDYEKPARRLEQYPTDTNIASKIIHTAILKGDVKGKVIADLGAGTGILGLGSLIGEPRKVYLVEIDKKAIERAMINLKKIENVLESVPEVIIVNRNVKEFSEKVDTVLMNPPYGKFKKGLDKLFLSKALKIGDVIYTLLNVNSEPFVRAFCEDYGFYVETREILKVRLKQTFAHHKKNIYNQPVDYYRLVRI